MTLRELLKKKDDIAEENSEPSSLSPPLEAPEFTFLRTTTNTQEVIAPPSYPGDKKSVDPVTFPRRHSFLRRHSHASKENSAASGHIRGDRRLSDRLHLGSLSRSRSASASSIKLPPNLPEIQGGVAHSEEEEAEWEKQATLLAKGSTIVGPTAATPNTQEKHDVDGKSQIVSISDKRGDDDIQQAIRLHEEGDLQKSTEMFGRLADPKGPNNALSQVLYGLALRHGWGCVKDEERAVTYLTYAASNSAEIESLALQAGMKKGGAAKGELTLAIFELANCFRHGWGVKKDPIAACKYYETAANMGDIDAMNEAAWCYVEGFGCKKNKFKAAQYLRLAEERGSKTVGNSWIWKDKYGGPRKT